MSWGNALLVTAAVLVWFGVMLLWVGLRAHGRALGCLGLTLLLVAFWVAVAAGVALWSGV